MTECELITALDNEHVWDYLEGNLEPEFVTFIRSHCLWCRSCLDFFGDALSRLQESDPRRYYIYQIENFAVRKAELTRFCKRNNIELDITQLTDPKDFGKFAIGAILKEYAPRFYKLWDSASEAERGEMMVDVLQCIEEMLDEG